MRTTPYHEGRHLSADALNDASAICPACAFDGRRSRGHRIQGDPDVYLLACPRCGIQSASRMPTPATLEAYYSAYYEHTDADADAITFAGVTRFATHIAGRLEGKRACLRVLDFGGGDGSVALASAAAAIGDGRCAAAEVTIVDYAAPRASSDPRITVRALRELGEVEASARYDLIIASAILEHVPEVGAVARQLFGFAAPGAVFYARTPYWAPILRVFPKVDLTFPGHVHDMGAPFWNRVVDTFGLDADVLASAPSIVETSLAQAPLRTLAGHALKLPSRLEVALRGTRFVRPLWGFVGGWEVFLRFR